jgi:hypothetical protein
MEALKKKTEFRIIAVALPAIFQLRSWKIAGSATAMIRFSTFCLQGMGTLVTCIGWKYQVR